MKKFYLLFFLLAIFVNSFGQATPTTNMRIATATTAFGVNIPVGFTIYDVGANKYYVCKAATISTGTLTANAANFQELLTTVLADGKVIIGNSSGVAAPVSITGDMTITNAGVTTVANAAGNMRVNGTLKIVGTDDDAAPDSILTVAAGVVKRSATTLFQTSALTDTKILVGNGSNVATAVNVSGDATIANTGALTVTNAAGNMRVVGTLKNVGITDDAAPDSIVTVAGGIFKRSATSLFQMASAVKTAIVEEMEVATADSAAVGRYYYTLAHTPVAGTVTVQVNGSAIKLTTQYLLLTNKIRVGFSLGQYDKLLVAYSY
jgi:hypothetical protein